MFLEIINLSTLTKEQALKPAVIISKTELLKVLKPKKNDKLQMTELQKRSMNSFAITLKTHCLI